MNSCGNRTEHCNLCNHYIKLKDQRNHLNSNCKFPVVADKPKLNQNDFHDNIRPFIQPINPSSFYNKNNNGKIIANIDTVGATNIYDPTLIRHNNIKSGFLIFFSIFYDDSYREITKTSHRNFNRI